MRWLNMNIGNDSAKTTFVFVKKTLSITASGKMIQPIDVFPRFPFMALPRENSPGLNKLAPLTLIPRVSL